MRFHVKTTEHDPAKRRNSVRTSIPVACARSHQPGRTHRPAKIVIFALIAAICGCEQKTPPATQPADDSSRGTAQAPPVSATRQAEFEAETLRGKALHENRDASGAVEAFEKAAAISPGEPAALRNLVRALLRAQRYADAESLALRLAEIQPEHSGNHYLLGLARLHRGDPPRAATAFERTLRLDTDCVPARFQLALALKADDQTQRVRELLEEVVRRDPLHWSAHYQLAGMLRNAGENEAADAHLREFERISEQLPYTQRGAEALEECPYTQIESGMTIRQPRDEPHEMRFTALKPGTDSGEPSRQRVLAHLRAGLQQPLSLLIVSPQGDVRVWPDVLRTSPKAMPPIARFEQPSGAFARVADFNNDGFLDVLIADAGTTRLLAGAADEAFTDVTQASQLDPVGAIDAAWIDFDHEGDVDLLTIRPSGDITLWINRGNGTFERADETVGDWIHLHDAERVIPVDFDDDAQRDLVILRRSAPAAWLRSIGLGRYAAIPPPLGPPDATPLLLADLDQDARTDAILHVGDTLFAYFADGRLQQLSEAPREGMKWKPVVFGCDADSDGWLDLIVDWESDEHNAPIGALCLRNRGTQPWRELIALTDALRGSLARGAPCALFDLDGDGDADLVATTREGAPLILLQESVAANRLLRVDLVGTKSNRAGIGTRIEIHTPGTRIVRDAWQLPLEIGIGDVSKLELVRTSWTNGVLHNILNIDPRKPLRIEEPLVAVGSCPYLYIWNGHEFEFVTDLLGCAPLGLSLKRGMFVPADPDEYVWIGDASRLVPRDGRYVIQIADELREVVYLDEVKLVVVDHPIETDVYPTDRIQPPPFPPSQLWLLGERITLRSAVDSAGRDVTAALLREDGERAGPITLREPQLRGISDPFSIELDFGPITESAALTLALNGWILWGDASVNVAAGQNPELPFPFPRLEARIGDSWQPVSAFVGAPAGKPKRYAVDLAGALPKNAQSLRLTTAYEIHWDQIALYRRRPETEMRITTLSPQRAELAYRGVARQTRDRRSDPVTPIAGTWSPEIPWRGVMRGYCTRYGDVTELVKSRDDRLAILNTGDFLTLEFPADLPPPPADQQRSFFLWLVGWDKDSDHNVACGDTVEPLPFHGMEDQEYGRQPPPPPRDDWQQRYNTRWVGP